MKKEKNNIHGIILLDKPTGMSSNRALQNVKHLFNAKKAGHTGSLDPLATGLLPICLGQATKISEYLLNSHKKYTTVIKLGQTTDTLDSEGQILKTKPVAVSEDQLQDALIQFRGAIKQIPPMYSALKKDGQPLYKLARKGEEIERPARDMHVYDLLATRIDEDHVRLEVHCSSGFYIRSLADDLGQVLGCGAHVIELRRTAIKDTDLTSSVTLAQLESAISPEAYIRNIDSLLGDMPVLEISEEQQLSLLQGRMTMANSDTLETPAEGPLSRIYSVDGKLFGIGRLFANGQLKTQKMFITEE